MNNQRNPLQIILVTALITAIVAGGGIYAWMKSQQAPTNPVAPTAQIPENQQSPAITTTNEANNTPVIIFTEKTKETDDNSRSWPTVKIMKKVGNNAPELLVDNIGKVGEYPSSFMLSLDKKTLYINLESKIKKLDLATKTLTDFFTPKKQVQSLFISKDGKRMYIWDQIYASTKDSGYALHLVDPATGADTILKQGTLPDGTYLFINAERNDGILTLSKAMGEASEPWTFNPKIGELRKVPGASGRIVQSISSTGKYISISTQDVPAICHDIFGALPSIYELSDSYTGKKIGTFGVKDMATDILGYSPDDSEVLFASYPALSKVTPENSGTTKECEVYNPPKTYYRMVIGTGKALPITDYKALLKEWGNNSKNFETAYKTISDSQVQYVISYKGSDIFQPTMDQSVVAMYEER